MNSKKISVVNVFLVLVLFLGLIGFSIMAEEQPLYSVCKANKCGYINQSGKLVIPLQYGLTTEFFRRPGWCG